MFAQPLQEAAVTREMLEDIDAIVWMADESDPDSRVCSSGAARLLGRPTASWREPIAWAAIIHPDDRAWVLRRHEAAIARGESHVLEYRLIGSDGGEHWIRDRVRVDRDPLGQPRSRGLLFDVSAEKSAEQALREQRDLADAILETSEMMVVLLDREGTIQRANRACETLLGAPAHTLVGRPFASHFADSNDQALAGILIQRVGSGRSSSATEIRARKSDGSLAPISWTFAALREKNGRLIRIVASGLDVSERVASEDRLRERAAGLRHTQKMEAIGRLASGVSHEFNNVFTALLGFTQALEFELADDARLAPLTEGLRETLEHATALTTQLRSMGRRDPEVLRALDLAAEVAARTPLLRRMLGEEWGIELELPGAGSRVLGDPGQLQQLLLNLVLNARDAMPTGGGLLISVSRIEGLSGSAATLELAVRDHGAGMDEETCARIFEPFFSTKGDSGSGLGLTAVYAIAEQWGGEVIVESEPGRGTHFRIRWPEHTAGSTSTIAEECDSEPIVPRLRARVLLVEDEPRVRRLMLEALRRDGHSVLGAGDGREALVLAEAQAEPIDLVVTDVVMPRMGGRELVETLRRRQPELRVLFVSGYPDDTMLRRGIIPNGAEFLQKPFQPATLVHRVRELLASPHVRTA